ncbi:MAG: phenylalanine--tRNA ligase subunit beta [Gammaproteobacteria bacterium HGW-Gammaproteobacteria-8]|nr:MAG: phenylalanine--tRNA ligase subunit beta [Gammaproteobacteria bacterium HGW-Gammaproteobacteria-8]
MRFSLNWLRHWVPGDADAETVAARLTGAGLEVDELQALGTALDGVVVGRIVDCQPHPDADRLRVCRVDLGASDSVQIVCGAPNARVGLTAPLATVGSSLPNGMKIRPARLRGVESQGMLCSGPELELGQDASGLLELDPALPPGTPLAEALGLPDHVIEVDLTPNRADCLSIRGLARELAAIDDIDCVEPEIAPVAPSIDAVPSIELLAPRDCPRYVGRIIEGLDPAARTPAWMVERLERSGLRSRGPGVDVTNYVLLELGQPMHAFDADRLEGGIRVRRASGDESLVLLDGQQVTPDPDMLLICDHVRPLALAGIMGGADSAVGEATTRILLESAWFNPASIIGKGRRFGLATDSSHRFERGVDPALQRSAIERATALILEIAGGRAGPVVEALASEHLPASPEIELRLARLNQVLGTSLDAERVERILVRLGMRVQRDGDRFTVQPPSARVDLALEIDLIEEVARLVGYDALPSLAPGGRLRVVVESERQADLGRIRHGLQARGFQEIVTWSFVAEDELQRLGLADDSQPLANPLSQDLAVLRTGLLPGLLRTARANLRQQQPRLKLYETGHVFSAGQTWGEHRRLGLLLAGQAEPESWHGVRRGFDFFDLKGELEQLFACIGHAEGEIRFVADAFAWLHPGQSARLERDGAPIGFVGQLHPAIASELDIETAVFVAEIELEALQRKPLPQFRGVSKFPAVRRDLALIVPETVAAERLRQVAGRAAGKLLENCLVFDVYQGKGIDSSYKSLAIGLILRDLSSTLRDQDVDAVIQRVIESLQQECNARLRG